MLFLKGQQKNWVFYRQYYTKIASSLKFSMIGLVLGVNYSLI